MRQGKPEPPAFVKPNQAINGAERATEEGEYLSTTRLGNGRRREQQRIERHVLERRCPDCAYRLSGESLDYTREVIELPAPQSVEVMKHQVIKRWCPCCGRWRSPKLDLAAGQVPRARASRVRVANLVSYLRTTLRLPFRAIQAHLVTLHNLRLSVGKLVELTGPAVRRQLQPQADQLKAAVQTSTVAHGDETSWRENGQNGYAWAFVTARDQAVRYWSMIAAGSSGGAADSRARIGGAGW